MMLGKGVYDVAEAARLTGVSPQMARRWFMPTSRTNTVRPDYEPVGRHLAISFLELIDLRVVGWLRTQGVSLVEVRRVHALLRGQFGIRHPFADQRFLTDGRTIVNESPAHNGKAGPYRALGRTIAFSELRRHLHGVEYDPSSGMANRWRIARGVVIDPQLRFGKPIVSDGCMATWLLYRAYMANRENADFVARLYETTAKAVRAAVAFERSLSRAA